MPEMPPKKTSFKHKRNALLLTAAFFASAAIPGVSGAPARYVGGAAVEAPGMLYTTHKDETVYLSAPQYDAKTHEWTVRGIPYSNADYDKEGILFKLQPNMLTDAWSAAHKQGVYDPARVVAPIAPAQDGTWTPYRVTYHSATTAFLQTAPKGATLLQVKEAPKEEAKASRSGIPVSLPPGVWSRAFTPF